MILNYKSKLIMIYSLIIKIINWKIFLQLFKNISFIRKIILKNTKKTYVILI